MGDTVELLLDGIGGRSDEEPQHRRSSLPVSQSQTSAPTTTVVEPTTNSSSEEGNRGSTAAAVAFAVNRHTVDEVTEKWQGKQMMLEMAVLSAVACAQIGVAIAWLRSTTLVSIMLLTAAMLAAPFEYSYWKHRVRGHEPNLLLVKPVYIGLLVSLPLNCSTAINLIASAFVLAHQEGTQAAPGHGLLLTACIPAAAFVLQLSLYFKAHWALRLLSLSATAARGV